MNNYKKLILVILLLILMGAFAWWFGNPQSSSMVSTLTNGGKWLLPLISIAALVDSINPCAFSILLMTIAFLFSIGKLQSNILRIGSAYILGIFVVYVLIGLGLLQVLHVFDTPHFMAKVGAALLVVLGLLNILKEFYPNLPVSFGIPHSAHHKMAQLMEKGSLAATFALGAFVGLCEFPCTGGPYLTVLGLLHDQSTYVKGFGYLLLYNLIFVLPLVLILILGSRKEVLQKVKAWQTAEKRKMKLIAGIAMVALGLLIYSL